MTLSDTEPSADALAIASEYFRNGVERELAFAFGRFGAARVEAERERCAKIADADAQNGRDDMYDRALDKRMVGARILAAERIAHRIRSREVP